MDFTAVFCISFRCVVLGTRNTPHSREILMLISIYIQNPVFAVKLYQPAARHASSVIFSVCADLNSYFQLIFFVSLTRE